jgi:hypothetical protein
VNPAFLDVVSKSEQHLSRLLLDIQIVRKGRHSYRKLITPALRAPALRLELETVEQESKGLIAHEQIKSAGARGNQ